MYFTKLHIANFRNIQHAELNLHQTCNLFYGDNGSGKTSLLEAIYYLNTAKSFRSHLSSRIINYDQEKFTLFAALQPNQNDIEISLGLERTNDGNTTIHLQREKIDSIVAITRLAPIQIIHQNSFDLLESGPRYKRKFIDWGMFHVEHNFLQIWKNYKRALEQRNATLHNEEKITTNAWDYELAKWGEMLHQWRSNYIENLLPIINKLLTEFLGDYTIRIEYYPGWNIAENLYNTLKKSILRDQTYGSTQRGPHRADLRLLINNIPIKDVLSRGQQKIFILMMHVAQGILLQQLTTKECIFIIDDLAAELDKNKQQQIAKILKDINSQVFISALTKESLTDLQIALPNKTFCVEKGVITKV